MWYGKALILFFLLFSTAPPANASGIPVIDVAALGEQMMHYVSMMLQYSTQLQQYSTQAQQYSTQLQQLQNDYTNLTNLNFKTNLGGLGDMQRVMNSAVGMANDVSRMQAQFETLYPDFASYQNQSGAAFSQQAALWAKQNQASALDTMRVQAAIQQNIADDAGTLQTLNDRSDAASGVKDLLQVSNQLLIVQAKQLMQLEQLLSSTAKADAAYMAEQASKEAAASARSREMSDRWSNRGTRTVNPDLDRLH